MARKNTEELRLPPQNIEAEMAVLGGILLGGSEAFDKVAEVGLKWMHFYNGRHGIVYRKMSDLVEKRIPVDLLTLVNSFKEEDLKEIGGAYFLSGLSESVPSAANVGYYTKIVMDQSARRRMIAVNQDAIEGLYGEMLPEEAANIVLNAADKLDQGEGFKHFSVGVEAAMTRLALIKDTGKPPGYEVPWIDMRELITLEGGDLIVLAGRPSMGKTAMADDMAQYTADIHKLPVGIFSIEMSDAQLAARGLMQTKPVGDETNIKTGHITDAAFAEAMKQQAILSELPIYVEDSSGQTIQQIRSRARRLKSRHGIGLIVIDYLQLITGAIKNQTENTEYGEYSRELKALARELDVPVILLSQLSRDVEKRGGLKIPIASDLRASGNIEQDADIIIMIVRPEEYNIFDDPTGTWGDLRGAAIVNIPKNRNGSTGMLKLAFDKERTKFRDYSNMSDNDMPPL